jgi:hypothetical protein
MLSGFVMSCSLTVFLRHQSSHETNDGNPQTDETNDVPKAKVASRSTEKPGSNTDVTLVPGRDILRLGTYDKARTFPLNVPKVPMFGPLTGHPSDLALTSIALAG